MPSSKPWKLTDRLGQTHYAVFKSPIMLLTYCGVELHAAACVSLSSDLTPASCSVCNVTMKRPNPAKGDAAQRDRTGTEPAADTGAVAPVEPRNAPTG